MRNPFALAQGKQAISEHAQEHASGFSPRFLTILLLHQKKHLYTSSIHHKAIEQTVTSCAYQVLLAASS